MVFYVDVVTELESEQHARSYFLLFRADYETSQPDVTVPANSDAGAFIQYKLGLESGNLRVEEAAEKSLLAPGERIRAGAVSINDEELSRLRF